MAKKTCDICGSEFRESNAQTFALDEQKVIFCPVCWSRLDQFRYNASGRSDAFNYFETNAQQEKSSDAGVLFFNNYIVRKDLEIKEEAANPTPDDNYEDMCSKFILSTANNLEGYRIKKQLGVVFGETVFKPSAGQLLASGIGDMFRGLSFSAKEMTGQVSIIEEARKFAYLKMMKEAWKKGANAIIAIDSDNTIGESICYLSLYGTAVYAVPENVEGQQE